VWPPQVRPGVSEKVMPGNYVRVFFTGENVEPAMEKCEFALSFSRLVDHPNHMRLPIWVYGARKFGYTPDKLVKSTDIDWEKVAVEKTEFCNFVYSHNVPFRNRVFSALNAYRRVDAAGVCMHNMNGRRIPDSLNWQVAKLEFLRRYKFTLAVESALWPGYVTEKLVHPMFAGSIPIYVGDPMVSDSFNPDAYIDFARFATMREMIEFVREVDNDHALYLKMLAAPFFRDNKVPEYARDETILAFFERIFIAARERRERSGHGTGL
jgi:hypothetical protein